MNQPIKNWEERFEREFPFEPDWKDFDLSEKEREIMTMRSNRSTLEEVGKKFGVTRERVRQIEAKAKEKIRQKQRIKSFIKSLLSEATREAVEKERERIEKLIKSLDVVGYPAISTSEFESMVDEALRPKDSITNPKQ